MACSQGVRYEAWCEQIYSIEIPFIILTHRILSGCVGLCAHAHVDGRTCLCCRSLSSFSALRVQFSSRKVATSSGISPGSTRTHQRRSVPFTGATVAVLVVADSRRRHLQSARPGSTLPVQDRKQRRPHRANCEFFPTSLLMVRAVQLSRTSRK